MAHSRLINLVCSHHLKGTTFLQVASLIYKYQQCITKTETTEVQATKVTG